MEYLGVKIYSLHSKTKKRVYFQSISDNKKLKMPNTLSKKHCGTSTGYHFLKSVVGTGTKKVPRYFLHSELLTFRCVIAYTMFS